MSGGCLSAIIPHVSHTLCLPFHRLPSIQQIITTIRHLRHTKVTIIRYSYPAAFSSLLCRDNDYTIRSLRTVDRSSGSIFQDLQRLDIIRIDRIDIHIRDTVHNNQWVRTIQRADTTDTDSRLTTRSTRVRDIHTGSLSLQGF